MSTLTNSVEKPGLLTYATSEGSPIRIAAKHVGSYQDLPKNCLLVYTSGAAHKLAFHNSTDKAAAALVLDDVLAD